MRNIIGKASIAYTDAVSFCFSQMMINISEVGKGIESAEFTISGGGAAYYEIRESFHGRISIDICRYAQLFFSDTFSYDLKEFSKTALNVSVTVGILFDDNDTWVFNFNTLAIWGLIGPDELLGGKSKIRWFENYPLTVNVLAGADQYFDVMADKKPLHPAFKFPTAQAEINSHIIDIAKEFSTPKRELYLSCPFSTTIKNDVVNIGVTSYQITVDRSNSGLYLRWIDNLGRYCYWLFKVSARSETISEATKFERAQDIQFYSKGFVNPLSYQRSKTSVGVVTCAAVAMDDEEYKHVKSVISAPLVDLYMGENNWKRINVQPGTFTEEMRNLKNISINIEMEQRKNQQL